MSYPTGTSFETHADGPNRKVRLMMREGYPSMGHGGRGQNPTPERA